ncbi:MAG: hypothetical protein JWO86_8084 [Myxococcaceae bacterium]|jgi:hypothetical protein|nr:hypothetical protein [Myxococcaceae bacterium]
MALLLALGFVAAATAACVDVTPFTDADVASDAGVAVAVADLPEVAKSACFACAAGGSDGGGASCPDEYAACSADPKCLSIFTCGIPLGCYAPGTDLIACFSSCGVAAGLTGIGDPAVAPFLALRGCMATSCSAPCAGDP